MTNKRAKQIRLIYGILLSISLVAAAICLMVACLGIYHSGEFSREAVAASFSRIAVPVYLCLGMVIAGFVLDWILPSQSGKLSAGKQNAQILKRLHSKTDLSQCDETLRSAVDAQQRSRRLYKTIGAVLLAVGAVIFLAYALNGSNFQLGDISGSMIRAMYVLLPCLAVPFGWAVYAAYHNAASMEQEIALLKQAGPAAKKAAPPREAAAASPKQLLTLRNVVIAVGLVLLVYGFFTGGTADVLTKAVNICTECVGLG